MSALSDFTRALDPLLRSGDLPLPDLDEDELAALLGADARSMPPVPTLGDPDAEERGRERLSARGLLDEGGRQDSDLELLLTMRSCPEAIVLAEQAGRAGHRVSCFLGLPGIAFLEEVVADEGHRFTLRSAQSTVGRLTGICNPSGMAGADGPPTVVGVEPTKAPWGRLDEDAHATRLRATRWVDGDVAEAQLTIVASGGGIWASSDAVKGAMLTLPLSDAGLRELVSRLVEHTAAA